MVVIIGLPNAGKTTYSKRFGSVLHYDDISKHRRAERLEIYRKADVDCIEGIYNSRKSRAALLEVFKGEFNVCIWIDTPTEECLRRERECRKRGDLLVINHAQKFEPPTLDEGWDEIIRIT